VTYRHNDLSYNAATHRITSLAPYLVILTQFRYTNFICVSEQSSVRLRDGDSPRRFDLPFTSYTRTRLINYQVECPVSKFDLEHKFRYSRTYINTYVYRLYLSVMSVYSNIFEL